MGHTTGHSKVRFLGTAEGHNPGIGTCDLERQCGDRSGCDSTNHMLFSFRDEPFHEGLSMRINILLTTAEKRHLCKTNLFDVRRSAVRLSADFRSGLSWIVNSLRPLPVCRERVWGLYRGTMHASLLGAIGGCTASPRALSKCSVWVGFIAPSHMQPRT